jgi:hypothetical protein
MDEKMNREHEIHLTAIMGRSPRGMGTGDQRTIEMAEQQIAIFTEAIQFLERRLQARRDDLAMWQEILRRTPQ